MANYDYKCPTCGAVFEVTKKMLDASRQEFCPACGTVAKRVFVPPPVVYACDGFHNTDYFKGVTGIGSKADQLNKAWSAATGEEPPPPAKDVPRNSREKY